MSRRAHPETALHLACAQYLRVALRPPTIWSTFPAGGGGRVRGAILKGAGLAAGWPDLIVMTPGSPGQSLVVGIELKSARGSLSPEQRAMRAAFKAAGANYAVCRSLEDVAEALRMGCIPLHATVAGNGSLRRSLLRPWPRKAA